MTNDAKGQLHELTSTRFFAAMAVFLGHFSGFLEIPAGLLWLVGGFGVSFFFVLSGFILTYRYWDEFAAGVPARSYWRYLVARFARIYPCYVLALLMMTALYLAMNAVKAGAITFPGNVMVSWTANLLALQTWAPSYETQQNWNGPAWSISTEFGFYLACPLILAALARLKVGLRGLVVLLAIVVVLGAAIQVSTVVIVFERGMNRDYWLDIIASRNIFWRFPEFLVGVVAARFLYGGHLRALERAGPRNALLAAGLATLAILNLAPWPITDPFGFYLMRQIRLDIGYIVPFAAIVLALAAGPTFLSLLLRRPSWVFLGEISYAIYIYHWFPWTVISHGKAYGLNLPPSLVTGVVVLTILFSAASFVWYERPARLFIRRKLAP